MTAFPNTKKKVENTMCSGAFLANIEVFGNVINLQARGKESNRLIAMGHRSLFINILVTSCHVMVWNTSTLCADNLENFFSYTCII